MLPKQVLKGTIFINIQKGKKRPKFALDEMRNCITLIELKLLNMITVGPDISDHINRRITRTSEFY